MTTIVLPLDAASGTPTFSAQQTRQAFSAFLGPAPSGRPLGAISGVRPGTPSTTVTVTGTTWSCAAHSGVLDVEASAAAGPYLYATDGSDSGSVTAADGTNPRIDIVYVQVSDNVQDSSGSEGGVVGYLAGTAAATPTAPGAPPRSMVIANISVPKLGGGNPSVSWVAPTFGVSSSGWTSYTPTWTAITTNPSLGNGTLTGKYLYDPDKKIAHAKITLTIGSTTTKGSGAYIFSLPVKSTGITQTSVGGGGIVYDASSPTQYACQAYFNDVQSLILTQNSTRVTDSSPVTWAAGDIISFSVFYETA